jgi:plastocyanin
MPKRTKLIDAKNTILIIAVLAVVGFVGFWQPYLDSRSAPVPTSASEEAEVVVKYTANGFEPSTISIPVGTTVEWENTGGLPMWVASDPHPSHTDLEGFDQLRIINRLIPRFVERAHAHGGGIYKYTFNEPGTWKYHNHVNPKHVGTVEVQ